MKGNSGLLARYEGLGSVVCCTRGCVHVQLGVTAFTLTEAQYLRLVAMLAHSAANYEMHRRSSFRARNEAIEGAGADREESDYPDARSC